MDFILKGDFNYMLKEKKEAKKTAQDIINEV